MKNFSDYDHFVFNEIRKEINCSLKFILSYCKDKNIKSIRKYFLYKSDVAQIYPDSLDHLFKGKLSVYYLVYNRSFIEYFYGLHDDIRMDLDRLLFIADKKEIIKQNKYLMTYLKKILNKNFLF